MHAHAVATETKRRKSLRDTENGVPIDVVLAGEYPGDGRPKPVAFPDPAVAAVHGDRIALLPLPQLVELKLASGMTAPHRLRDLADVLKPVRVLGLPAGFGDSLAPSCATSTGSSGRRRKQSNRAEARAKARRLGRATTSTNYEPPPVASLRRVVAIVGTGG